MSESNLVAFRVKALRMTVYIFLAMIAIALVWGHANITIKTDTVQIDAPSLNRIEVLLLSECRVNVVQSTAVKGLSVSYQVGALDGSYVKTTLGSSMSKFEVNNKGRIHCKIDFTVETARTLPWFQLKNLAKRATDIVILHVQHKVPHQPVETSQTTHSPYVFWL